MPLFTTQVREEAATGACILAMVGSGRFRSVDEATRVLVQYTHPTLPEPAWVEVYHRLYQKFRQGYTALRELSPGS
jgi:xylulokinase